MKNTFIALSLVIFSLMVFTFCQPTSRLGQDKSDHKKTDRYSAIVNQPAGEHEDTDCTQYRLPDGYILNIVVVWGERKGEVYTEDGVFLVMNPEGYYEYALKDDQGLPQPTGIMARNPEDRTREETILLERHRH